MSTEPKEPTIDTWPPHNLPPPPPQTPPIPQTPSPPPTEPQQIISWTSLQIPEVREAYRETVHIENNVRKWISYAIVSTFFAWSIIGIYYLMFQNGQTQVLVTGSAFITGPLGVVIGFYFGRGDRK